MTARTRRRRGPGALMVVAMLLAFSALMRLPLVGDAAAERITAKKEMREAAAEDSLALIEIAPRLAEMARLAEERLAELDIRESELDARAEELAQLEIEIERGLARLDEAEQSLREKIAIADGAAEDDVSKLTSVYENMEPAIASELFSRMEPRFAAGFLGRMRSETAASILGSLDPDLAYSISVVLAGRNVGLVSGTVED